MEPLESRKAHPYWRSRDPTQVPRAAQYDERSAHARGARGARGRPPKSYARPAPQVAPSSTLRHHGRSANNSRPRQMERYHPYDRQPQHVAIHEDEEDGEMVYHDEEPSYDEDFGDLEDPRDPQHDNKYNPENPIKAQSKATLALPRSTATLALPRSKATFALPSYDEEFGDLEDPQDPQRDNKYDLENVIRALGNQVKALGNQVKALENQVKALENQTKAQSKATSALTSNLRTEFHELREEVKQTGDQTLEGLKEIKTDTQKLPKRFGEEISTMAGAQANFQAQGATGQGAPFQMGPDSTVDPSSLTSNTRGNGNNGS